MPFSSPVEEKLRKMQISKNFVRQKSYSPIEELV